MSMFCKGVYVDDGDKAYELETCYYLQFHIKSALVSIGYLLSPDFHNIPFNNKAQYYHYYTDHLLFAMGQITERFQVKDKNKDKLSTQEKLYNERREINRKNFSFDKSNFPILSNKDYRNTIEHIDEYNTSVIWDKNGVGGFNYIDNETPIEIKDKLLSNRRTHIYTLDILSRKIYITKNKKEMNLCIDKLKDELNELENNVLNLLSFIEGV